MILSGDYNTADVKVDSLEDTAIDQIQEMVDHDAFTGDDDVAIMPDAHWGFGAVIGFTMPLHDRVVPGTVGVDIGCGMYAVCLGRVGFDFTDTDILASVGQTLDSKIRDRVPVGFDVHDRNDFHMGEDFPWQACENKLATFNEHSDFADIDADYGLDYFKSVCERVGCDVGRAINSIGTLGGGNHFIELGYDSDDHVWAIIHSGSRGIGASIADFWTERATKIRSSTNVRKYFLHDIDSSHLQYLKFDPRDVSDEDLLDWIQGGMGEDFVDHDALKADYKETDPEMIGRISDTLKDALDYVDTDCRNTDLDYLYKEEAHGYIRDMIFAQTYASVSRKLMADSVKNAFQEVGDIFNDEKTATTTIEDSIESVHNYIDFRDQTIRKGACRSHDGERVVIPFNIKYGTLLCRGKGDSSWNHSAPHGAGRAMGRRDAKDKYDEEYMREETKGIYMSETPVDETPSAYKDPADIEEAIGPTAEVEERVVPFLNIKAD